MLSCECFFNMVVWPYDVGPCPGASVFLLRNWVSSGVLICKHRSSRLYACQWSTDRSGKEYESKDITESEPVQPTPERIGVGRRDSLARCTQARVVRPQQNRRMKRVSAIEAGAWCRATTTRCPVKLRQTGYWNRLDMGAARLSRDGSDVCGYGRPPGQNPQIERRRNKNA